MEKQRDEAVKKVVVERVSREILKPAAMTCGTRNPDDEEHPKTHKLSAFDQAMPSIYVPIIFFYRQPPPSAGFVLRASLAATLCDYYPLAGRMMRDDDSFVVDCNDEGVLFLETRVRCSLSEFLTENVDECLLELLVPQGFGMSSMEARERTNHTATSPLLAVQVTLFDCGAMAMCASFAHRVLDMASMSYFMRTWAANAAGGRGGDGGISLPPPEFNLGAIYPAAVDGSITSMELVPPKARGKRVAHARVVFNKSVLESLKQGARSERVQNPTTVEVVAGLIYLTAVNATNAVTVGSDSNSILIQAANLRSKVVPPLPECTSGNLIGHFAVVAASAATEEATTTVQLARVVSEIRNEKEEFFETFRGRSRDQVRSVALGWARALVGEEHWTSDEPADVRYSVVSWCGFGLYETDFGWGNPVWVVPVLRDMWNVTVLIDKTRGSDCGREIEAYVMLEEAKIEAFLSDKKMLTVGVRVNPSPLMHR